MLPLLPSYYKERFPIQLNWPGAARTLCDGCSLGPPGRISAEFWKPWSELFHGPEQRRTFPKIQDSLAFSRPTHCSQMLRSILRGQDRFNRDRKGSYPKESPPPSRCRHMRSGALTHSFELLHSNLRNILTVAFIALAVYECADLIVKENRFGLYYVGLVVLGLVALLVILKDWRKGVYVFVAWIAVEDLIRKYLGNNMIIYFAKDFLALVLYLSFFIARRSTLMKVYRPPFLITFLVFFWYCVIQALNPASTSIFYGLMGLKLCFMYVPLLFVGHALVDSERDLRRYFFFNCVLILVVAGFGLAQSILGHTFLNPELIQDDIRNLSTLYRVSPITGLIAYRPTSFFVSTGRFQNFLLASWILALGFGGFLLMRKQTGRLLGFTTVGIVAAASLMTASRGVFLWTLASAMVVAPAVIWGASWAGEQRNRVMRAIRRAAVFVAIALTILMGIFPQEVASRLAIYSETLSPYSSQSELGYRSQVYPLQNFVAAFNYPRWPYGYGTGTASLGVQYVARIMHAPPMNVGVENGYGQLVIELGIVGLLLWILLAYAITRSAWRAAKNLKGTVWFPIGFAIFLYAFLLVFPLSFYGFIAYQDFVMNAYLWLMLGILFRISEFPGNLPLAQITARSR